MMKKREFRAACVGGKKKGGVKQDSMTD